MHTITLSFATFALLNAPFGFRLVNPVIPSWQINGNAVCRDINAGLGGDDVWLLKCSRSFSSVKLSVAVLGLILMTAQWWALMTVRRWGREIRFQPRGDRADLEKAGILRGEDGALGHEKTGVLGN